MHGAKLHLPQHNGYGEMICYRWKEEDSPALFGIKVRLMGTVVPALPNEPDANGWVVEKVLPYTDVPLSEAEILAIQRSDEGFVLDSALSML